MNSPIFSIRRFADYLKLEIGENYRRLLIYAAVVVGVLIFLALTISYNLSYSYSFYNANPYRALDHDPALPTLIPLYVVLLFCFGAISASLMWTSMKSKIGRINTLMTPASYLEKFLVKFVVFIVLFLGIYIAGVFIAESIRYLILHTLYPEAIVTAVYMIGTYSHEVINNVMDPWDEKSIVAFTILGYFALVSLFTLGSVIWTRNSFVKTFACFGALYLSYFLIAMLTTVTIASGYLATEPQLLIFMRVHHVLLIIIGLSLICAINWTLAYFRLKETDVVNVKR